MRDIILRLDTSDLDEAIKKLEGLYNSMNQLKDSENKIVEDLEIDIKNLLSHFESSFKKEIRQIVREEVRKLEKKNSSR